MAGDHNKKYSNEQEKRIAKSIGGETQIASGALPIASKKGDVVKKNTSNWKILIDGKTSKVKTYQRGVREKVVKKDWLLKIKQEAFDGGYDIGAVAISFDNKKDYYIFEDVDAKNMIQALEEYELIINEQKVEIRHLNDQIGRLKNQINEVQKNTVEKLYTQIEDLKKQINSVM